MPTRVKLYKRWWTKAGTMRMTNPTIDTVRMQVDTKQTNFVKCLVIVFRFWQAYKQQRERRLYHQLWNLSGIYISEFNRFSDTGPWTIMPRLLLSQLHHVSISVQQKFGQVREDTTWESKRMLGPKPSYCHTVFAHHNEAHDAITTAVSLSTAETARHHRLNSLITTLDHIWPSPVASIVYVGQSVEKQESKGLGGVLLFTNAVSTKLTICGINQWTTKCVRPEYLCSPKRYHPWSI